MQFIFLSYLVLFSLFITSSGSDDGIQKVTFTGNFKCAVPSYYEGGYCFLLRYYEDDNFANDFIDRSELQCGSQEQSILKTEFPSGDGLLNNYYEFYVQITHNCSYGGLLKSFKLNFKPVKIVEDDIAINYNIDLTRYGHTVSRWWSTAYIDDQPVDYPGTEKRKK